MGKLNAGKWIGAVRTLIGSDPRAGATAVSVRALQTRCQCHVNRCAIVVRLTRRHLRCLASATMIGKGTASIGRGGEMSDLSKVFEPRHLPPHLLHIGAVWEGRPSSLIRRMLRTRFCLQRVLRRARHVVSDLRNGICRPLLVLTVVTPVPMRAMGAEMLGASERASVPGGRTLKSAELILALEAISGFVTGR